MLVCSLQISHARLRVHQTPGIPHALHGAEPTRTTRAHPRREIADSHATVIPKSKTTPTRHSGAMRSIEPGIHNPRPWLWIPGLRPRAHPGMTVVRIVLPSPQPSLRAQRSNPSSLRMCHGLLRCARNDDGWTALLRCHRTSTREFSRLFETNPPPSSRTSEARCGTHNRRPSFARKSSNSVSQNKRYDV